jgi:hypothetical protein
VSANAYDENAVLGRRLDWRDHDRIELAFPVDPALWALARLTASSIAARLDFAYEEVEDLRLAIDELCTSCASGAGPASRVALCFETTGDTLRVECLVDHIVGAGWVGSADELPDGTGPDALAEMILSELVDTHEIGPAVSGVRRGYLEKQRTADPS